MAYWRHFYHLVWATQRRQPLITDVIEQALHNYLSAKAQAMGCRVHAVNGMPDHVHIVVSIPPSNSVAEVVKQLKGGSSHHVNSFLRPSARFAWQVGYGSLTLGERQLSIAISYVENQKEHHQSQTIVHRLETCEDVLNESAIHA